jgi:hypothetical protein
MSTCSEETIKVVNGYMDAIQADKTTACTCTIVQFGYMSYPATGPLPIEQFPRLDRMSYICQDGATALFDGVGDGINIAAKTANRGDRIVVVVATDGGDNASRRFTASSIARRVAELHKEGNRWAFIMLGADGSDGQGIDMGFRPENVIAYNAAQPKKVFAALTEATRRMRRAAAAGEAYTDATMAAAGKR